MKNRKSIVIFSALLTIIFIATQFAFTRTYNVGICTPYLGAPSKESHPAFQATDHGFPFPFVTTAIDMCFDDSTQYDWLPIGVGVDAFVLALIAYPFWRPSVSRLKTKNQG